VDFANTGTGLLTGATTQISSSVLFSQKQHQRVVQGVQFRKPQPTNISTAYASIWHQRLTQMFPSWWYGFQFLPVSL